MLTRFRVPEIDFGDFLWFVGIWLLTTANPGMNWVEYFSKKTIYFLVGAQFVSTNLYLAIILKVSVMLSN